MQSSHEVAREKLAIQRKTNSKANYDKKSEEVRLQVDDKVLLLGECVQRGRSKKLSAHWTGSYEVLEVNKENGTIKKGQTR
jgi:hypothetical protein